MENARIKNKENWKSEGQFQCQFDSTMDVGFLCNRSELAQYNLHIKNFFSFITVLL